MALLRYLMQIIKLIALFVSGLIVFSLLMLLLIFSKLMATMGIKSGHIPESPDEKTLDTFLVPEEKTTHPPRSSDYPPTDMNDPEGRPIRILSSTETGKMGGVTQYDCLLPDGSYLQGLASCWAFSADNHYFTAPLPEKYGEWGLLLLDMHTHKLYIRPYDKQRLMFNADAVTDEKISGRGLKDKPVSVPLADIFAKVDPVQLVHFQDLWIEPGEWERAWKVEEITWPSPEGCSLHGKIHIPERFADMKTFSWADFAFPLYEIILNGEPSGLYTWKNLKYAWRADNLACACEPRRKWPESQKYALWRQGKGWHMLNRHTASSLFMHWDWPDDDADAMEELDEDYIWLRHKAKYFHITRANKRWQPPYPDAVMPFRIRHNGTVLGDYAIPNHSYVIGQALDGSGQILRSQALACGHRAMFFPVEGQFDGGKTCRIGNDALPGTWTEYRVSTNNRYIALRAAGPDLKFDYEAKGYETGFFFIYDSLNKTLAPCGDTSFVGFTAFFENTLCLVGLKNGNKPNDNADSAQSAPNVPFSVEPHFQYYFFEINDGCPVMLDLPEDLELEKVDSPPSNSALSGAPCTQYDPS